VEGKKTTTFRKGRKEGVYEVIEGSWYRPRPTGMKVRLTPIQSMGIDELISSYYRTEGDFNTPEDFKGWLKRKKLTLPELGWLHRLELVKVGTPQR